MTTIVQLNDLELRVATEAAELQAAQSLRYQVFYEEMGAVPDPAARRSRRDVDPFDAHAEHLIVIDHARSTSSRPHVVGCYRMLRESVARRIGGFYTSAEYDLSGVTDRRGEILELGRSCVAREYRSGLVMQLLWKGIAELSEQFGSGLMLGCASLPGTDVAAVAAQIRYLHERHLAPIGLRPCALAHRRIAHEPFGIDGYSPERAFRSLPPLLKAYLRVGAMIGEGGVLDEQFNTIDVCIVLPSERIERRYLKHYRQERTDDPVAA